MNHGTVLRAALSPFIVATLLACGAMAAAGDIVGELGLKPDAHPVRERAGWRPPRLVLLSDEYAAQLDELRALAPGARFVLAGAATPSEVESADVAILPCQDEALLRAARGLKWLQVTAAGVDRCAANDALRGRAPLITNMQRVMGPAMAEHVLAMMLALSRHFDWYMDRQREGSWADGAPGSSEAQELDGRTLLVVGLGGIGTEVARRAHALGMRVYATRSSGHDGPDFVAHVGTPDELLQLAAQADCVVNCLPLTPATTALFDRRFFAAMRAGGYFLSVGRGRSTVTDDLVAALRTHHLAGAGLDVTDPEPLPATSPLWKMPGVIITPHVAALSPGSLELRLALLRENLGRYAAGEPMLSVVDTGRGY
jgi:phosphoglycerate dehydrogenase-like enzyme